MSRQPGVYAVRVGVEWIMADFDGASFTCERGPIDEVGDRVDLAGGLNCLKARWQAEALEELAASTKVEWMRNMCRATADRYRRQAEVAP